MMSKRALVSRILLGAGLAWTLSALAPEAAAQTYPEAISFTQGWNSHSPASWHFQQVIDFSNASTSWPPHRIYPFWSNPSSGDDVRFMDIQHQAPANSGGKCWEYDFAQWHGEDPDFIVHANVGTVTAPRWQLLSDNPDGRGRLPRWRLWADPGSSTRNWGAVFRLSSFDRDSNEGVAILRVRHISDFSRWACENSAAVLRIVGATRRVIRVE